MKCTVKLEITGNVVTLRSNQCKITRYKKIFRSLFIKLLIKLKNNDFKKEDVIMWESLNKNEKNDLSYLISRLNIENDTFEEERAVYYEPLYEKIKTLSGAIKAGNNNVQLLKDYQKALDQLHEAGLVNTKYHSSMSKKIINSIIIKENEEEEKEEAS